MTKMSKNIQYLANDYLRGVSQALFFRSAPFGAALLAMILFFDPSLFLCAGLASLIGFGYTLRRSTPRALKDYGLVTINCFFFGLAMARLFQPSLALFACLIVGSIAMPVLTKALYEVTQHWKLSPLIMPYILAVWMISLCSHGSFLAFRPDLWAIQIAYLPPYHPTWAFAARLVHSVFLSSGRLLFLSDARFGFALIALVCAFSPRRGIYFLAGTAIATVTAFCLSGGTFGWEYGFYSFSAGLIGLGMASFPDKFSWRTIFIFCVLSSFLTLAMDQFFRGLQLTQPLPMLSLPYVLTLWIALLSRMPRLNLSWAPRNSSYQDPMQGSLLPVSQAEFEDLNRPAPEKAA